MLAAAADPRRADAPLGLGMLYMQIGRETEASDLFAAAFAADPFNVRADNMMKVLKHMSTYEPITTEHFTRHSSTRSRTSSWASTWRGTSSRSTAS